MKTCQTGSLKQRHGFAQNRNLNFPPKERVPATLAAKKVENKESQNGILIIPSRTLQGNPLGLCTMSLMNISSRGRMSWKKTSPSAFARTKQRSTKVLPWIPSSSVAFFRCSNNTFSAHYVRIEPVSSQAAQVGQFLAHGISRD